MIGVNVVTLLNAIEDSSGDEHVFDRESIMQLTGKMREALALVGDLAKLAAQLRHVLDRCEPHDADTAELRVTVAGMLTAMELRVAQLPMLDGRIVSETRQSPAEELARSGSPIVEVAAEILASTWPVTERSFANEVLGEFGEFVEPSKTEPRITAAIGRIGAAHQPEPEWEQKVHIAMAEAKPAAPFQERPGFVGAAPPWATTEAPWPKIGDPKRQPLTRDEARLLALTIARKHAADGCEPKAALYPHWEPQAWIIEAIIEASR